MNIGGITVKGKLALAPMAGVTGLAFRKICREQGAALTVTEMVSAKALCYNDKNTSKLLSLAPDEHPVGVQIFGHEPESMAVGAQIARKLTNCDFIDINMGCPAPKIVKNGDGSALMLDLELASKVIEAVINAVEVPVTVKFRKGFDEKHINCTEFALMAEKTGASAVTVHGRTRAQQYSGKADWDSIRDVKRAVSIPVIANGDVFAPQDAVNILEYTGADMAMIGRGALGNPWIFSRSNTLIETGECPEDPDIEMRMNTAVRQIELASKDKSERTALLEARRHINWYLKSQKGLKAFKARVCSLETLEQLYKLKDDIIKAAKETM